MSKIGKRLLVAVEEARAFARGESVEGMIVHEFAMKTAGERETITHFRNGVPDPVTTIR